MMSILDKAFQLIFARCRREFPESDLDRAFESAANRFHSYILWALVAFVVPPTTAIYSQFKIGAPVNQKAFVVFVGVVLMLAIDKSLDIRFKKFVASPPPLPPVETRAEWWYIFWFRVACLGLLIPVALIGFIVRHT